MARDTLVPNGVLQRPGTTTAMATLKRNCRSRSRTRHLLPPSNAINPGATAITLPCPMARIGHALASRRAKIAVTRLRSCNPQIRRSPRSMARQQLFRACHHLIVTCPATWAATRWSSGNSKCLTLKVLRRQSSAARCIRSNLGNSAHRLRGATLEREDARSLLTERQIHGPDQIFPAPPSDGLEVLFTSRDPRSGDGPTNLPTPPSPTTMNVHDVALAIRTPLPSWDSPHAAGPRCPTGPNVTIDALGGRCPGDAISRSASPHAAPADGRLFSTTNEKDTTAANSITAILLYDHHAGRSSKPPEGTRVCPVTFGAPKTAERLNQGE